MGKNVDMRWCVDSLREPETKEGNALTPLCRARGTWAVKSGAGEGFGVFCVSFLRCKFQTFLHCLCYYVSKKQKLKITIKEQVFGTCTCTDQKPAY